MRNLIIILLFFLFCSSECGTEIDFGFDEEPAIQIVFHDENQNFETQSASINKSKKPVLQNDLPGIDMNANSTKFWITRGTEIDSFVIFYKIHASVGDKKTLMNFDTLYIKESSFKNAKFINYFYLQDSFIDVKHYTSFVPYPVFYIR